MNRREFLGSLGAGAALAATAVAPGTAKAGGVEPPPKIKRPKDFMWAALLHFGMNMWGDWDGSTFKPIEGGGQNADAGAEDPVDGSGRSKPKNYMRFDYGTWKEVTQHMVDRGLNTLIIDIAEGVKWPRHPEIGAADAWSAERFVEELNRLKAMGLKLIPKMNFSASHDAWLKDYGHRLSTPEYYQVCADCIKDAQEMFGNPDHMHLGYEEEWNDKYCRSDDMWWNDFLFLVDKVEKAGARAWSWVDWPVNRPLETFLQKMPRSVMQNNGWYPEMNDLITCRDPRMYVLASMFAVCEKYGYDQVPCCSNYCTDKNTLEIVKMGDAVIRDGRLKGYLTTTWRGTVPRHRKTIFNAIDQLGEFIV